jgi:Domain of unknown function (DUF4965)/Domain of unknown function (DUF1793)/Domain of unknown function (DUF5127)/Domain of unknown function (DUF4964)
MRFAKAVCQSVIFVCVSVASIVAQQRVPATPLITHDPYFSVWSFTDTLTESDTTHWTGKPQPMSGIARIDDKPFRFMGRRPDGVPAMEQTGKIVAATHTRYRFRAAGVEIDFSFFTPIMMDDLDLFSRPVTYLTWSVKSADGARHRVSILFDVDPVIAVNDRSEQVLTTRDRTNSLDVVSVGSRDQSVLNRSGDDLRIDWGYFRVALPRSQQARLVISAGVREDFISSGAVPTSDSIGMPQPANRSCPHLAAELDFSDVSGQAQDRHLLVSYTEGYAIQYLERNLRPFWQRNDLPVEQMLEQAESQYKDLEARGEAFDSELESDLTKAGGARYAAIAILAYRQTIAAHKLVADVNGDPMLFAKENFSNGCIGTVDVLYPSAPFFLFFQPKLLEAQLLPVLEYAALRRWHFPFAPHDLGQYPLANGQVYGGGEQTEEDQMPVEESGNMLILLDALAHAEGNPHLAERYWTQLTSWAQFLRARGLDPENQLTTDDFAGHVAHNSNLSIKAIEALAAYADLAGLLGHDDLARQFKTTAAEMAEKWVEMAAEGDHFKLAFNSPGTWSQKYNLVWDNILGYHLFPEAVSDKELAYYMTKINRYGLPLDGRADYTKLDWSVWTATLASSQHQFDAIIDPIYDWVGQTPSRVPLTDWYDTKTGKQVGFQARSVVGGVYMKALSAPELAAKWSGRAKSASSP